NMLRALDQLVTLRHLYLFGFANDRTRFSPTTIAKLDNLFIEPSLSRNHLFSNMAHLKPTCAIRFDAYSPYSIESPPHVTFQYTHFGTSVWNMEDIEHICQNFTHLRFLSVRFDDINDKVSFNLVSVNEINSDYF